MILEIAKATGVEAAIAEPKVTVKVLPDFVKLEPKLPDVYTALDIS